MPHNVYFKLFQLQPQLREAAFARFDTIVLDEAEDCTDRMLSVLASVMIGRVGDVLGPCFTGWR